MRRLPSKTPATSPESVPLRVLKTRSNPSRAVSGSPVSWAVRLGRSVRPSSEDVPDLNSGVSITAAKGPQPGVLSRGHLFQAGPVGAAEPALADLDARLRYRRMPGHAGTSRIGDRRQHPPCLGGVTRPVRRKTALDLVRHRAQRVGRERKGPFRRSRAGIHRSCGRLPWRNASNDHAGGGRQPLPGVGGPPEQTDVVEGPGRGVEDRALGGDDRQMDARTRRTTLATVRRWTEVSTA